MNTLVVVLSVVALGVSQPVTDEQKEALDAIHAECVKDTGIEKEDIMKAMEENSDDPKVKEHMFCFLEKLEVINADGEIQKDVLEEKLTDFLDDEAKAKDIVAKCVEEKESAVETAFALGSCIHREKTEK